MVKRAHSAITQGWVTYLEVHRDLAAKTGNILRVREGVTYYVGSSRVYSLIGIFGYYTHVTRPVTMVKCHHCNLFHKISAGESSMPKELPTCLICEWWDACQSFWRRMCLISLGHDFGDICRPSIEHIHTRPWDGSCFLNSWTSSGSVRDRDPWYEYYLMRLMGWELGPPKIFDHDQGKCWLSLRLELRLPWSSWPKYLVDLCRWPSPRSALTSLSVFDLI